MLTGKVEPQETATRHERAHDIASLREIEQRLLWLSTAIVHHANHVRPNPSGLKVGGHQASCASMVSIMTALWFEQLQAGDRVSVKPHASPVLHAINFLLGELDERYLSMLRAFGGLQPYPSRSKDPDPVDYSTGSVGIGATAPIWGAIARRYVHTTTGGAGAGRQYSLVGDAELDEGAVWEAILDPGVAELGEVGSSPSRSHRVLALGVPPLDKPRHGVHTVAVRTRPLGEHLISLCPFLTSGFRADRADTRVEYEEWCPELG